MGDKEGQPGLGYIFYKEGLGSGPIAKNIGEDKKVETKDNEKSNKDLTPKETSVKTASK